MRGYVVRRLLQAIPVFVGASLLIYTMVFVLPGDPVLALAGERRLPDEVLDAIRAQYNLDDPLLVQYGKWIAGVFSGDLGRSFSGRPVADILASRFPVTVRLALVAVAFELVLAGIAGTLAALRRGSFVDRLVLVSTVALMSIPVFVLGYVLQLVVGVRLGWLPISGSRAGWASYVLPGFVLAAASLAYVARLLRASLGESLRADYIRTAEALGLPRRRIVTRHALRNSLIPVVTYVGADVGLLMGGAIVTEAVFNLPGIGGELFRAIGTRDGTVIVGIVTALVGVFVLVNLLVDVLYAVLDPRIRYGQRRGV